MIGPVLAEAPADELAPGNRHRDAVDGADRLTFSHAMALGEIPKLEHYN